MKRQVHIDIIYIFALLILVLVTFSVIPGCSSYQDDGIDSSGKDRIIYFSDSSSEDLLRALSNNDYKRFTKDFDKDLASYITQEKFNAIANSFNNDLGKYIEHSIFLKPKEIDIKEESIFISYKADFLKKPENNSKDRERIYEVIIVVAFEENGRDVKITDFRYFSLDLGTCIFC